MPMGCLILSLFSPRSLGIKVRTFFKYKVAILMVATLGNCPKELGQQHGYLTFSPPE
jgi:hypothetical protein